MSLNRKNIFMTVVFAFKGGLNQMILHVLLLVLFYFKFGCVYGSLAL